MAILIDTNVVLDFLLQRPDHYSAAKEIVYLARKRTYDFRISSLTLGTVYYLSRKEFSHDQTMLLLREFCVSIPCLGSAPNACSDALFMGMRDFEDALQVAMAKSECDMIITRNVADFKHCGITVVSPIDFLQLGTENG